MKWHVEKGEEDWAGDGIDYFSVVDDEGNIICDNMAYYPAAVDIVHAPLIAAAPELLEAMKAVISENHVDGAFDMARAAIAKAEGKA